MMLKLSKEEVLTLSALLDIADDALHEDSLVLRRPDSPEDGYCAVANASYREVIAAIQERLKELV